MIITETREKMIIKVSSKEEEDLMVGLEEEDLKVGLEEEASIKKEVITNEEVTKEVEEEVKIDCEIKMILSHRKLKFD